MSSSAYPDESIIKYLQGLNASGILSPNLSVLEHCPTVCEGVDGCVCMGACGCRKGCMETGQIF